MNRAESPEWHFAHAEYDLNLYILSMFEDTLSLAAGFTLCFLGCASLVIAFHHQNTPIYNFDLFKPHFYIVKLRFTRVYIIFLISAQKT